MSTRCNMRSVRTTLQEHFTTDAKLLAEVATLFGFAAAAGTGEPMSLAAGVKLITNTAASAISAGVALSKRFFSQSHDLSEDLLPKYERFRVVLYVTSLRCYIEAIPGAINALPVPQEQTRKSNKPPPDSVAQVKVELTNLAASLDEAEVTYLFGIRPLHDRVPLFDALSRWLVATLRYYGFDSFKAREAATQCTKRARDRFYVFLASEEEQADWMKRYLDLTFEDATAGRIVQDLAAIRETLAGWTHPASQMKQREQESWQAYRKDLKALPDQKETMYNEAFGVRHVFLQPQATYHIAGAEGDAGVAETVPDLARLFGAILSDRASGEDLIILCGGPGCGKSTLCRVLVSQLAEDPSIHPVFLRLRRLREGSDIGLFIEESLHRLGLINRLSDLRSLSNLVLVLDGFDELVMASRSRLRQFFNMLRDEHAAGPLRTAKILVSGRDTLFPAGEGLPTGSHVVSLLPFDPPRVTAWGSKWRQLHTTGPGKTFKPEVLLNGEGKGEKPAPLQHLVSWPLTLHLVARVHTAGRLNLSVSNTQDIQKAYLYRSILAETASRQTDQAQGRGRLDPDKMRKFLRSLAWQMYAQSTDSMDPSDVVPLLGHFFTEPTEADMSELADVAVVNCPELSKGEETGFEFIHKSFAEYLVAEHMAHSIERVIFKAPQFGSDEHTWRMTDDEAAAELAPVIGIRLLTEEVQEMLEPILGSLAPFLQGDRVDEVVSGEERRAGLGAIVDRFQHLLKGLLQGSSLDTINRRTENRLLIRSPLEAYANQCAGYLIIGTAAARQLRSIDQDPASGGPFFCAEPYDGAFWQCVSLMFAGGIAIDRKLAMRVTRGLSVQRVSGEPQINDITSPIRFGLLSEIEGYDPILSRAMAEHLQTLALIEFRSNVIMVLLAYFTGEVLHARPFRVDMISPGEMWGGEWGRRPGLAPFVDVLREGGFINDDALRVRYPGVERWRDIEHRLARSKDPRKAIEILKVALREMVEKPIGPQEEYTARMLAELYSVSVEAFPSRVRGKLFRRDE